VASKVDVLGKLLLALLLRQREENGGAQITVQTQRISDKSLPID